MGACYSRTAKATYKADAPMGVPHGVGVLYDPNSGRKVYEGGFKNGKLHGVGIVYYPDGARETREFSRGRVVAQTQ